MVQGYYTLDEAARILGMDPDKLAQQAQKREIRAFADRGTWRFRIQDVEERARQMGRGSSPDLQLGEAEPVRHTPSPAPRATASPVPRAASPSPKPAGMPAARGPASPTPRGPATPAPKGPATPQPRSPKPAPDEGVFDFSLSPAEEPVALDPEAVIDAPSSRRAADPSLSPAPKPGSDSDVHLVFDVGEGGSSDSDVRLDSDVRIEQAPPAAPKSTPPRRTGMTPDPGSKPSSVRKKATPPPGARPDSGVRLVPMDDDAGTASLGEKPPSSAAESDIRLGEDSGMRPRVATPAAQRPPSDDDLSMTTEEIDLDAELRKAAESAQAKKPRSQVKPKTGVKPGDKPAASPFELSDTSLEAPPPPAGAESDEELRLDSPEDEAVTLGELPAEGLAHASGINLDKPADSGINLEQEAGSDDSLEFELSLDQEATPKPAPAGEGQVDSSGEFELTLDDSGGLAPLEEEAAAPGEGSEKDIFETDFDMPALEEESGSEAVALDDADTELESSDFDLSLGNEESGSQVVALDEEEADEGAATVAARSGRRLAAEEGEEEEPEAIDDLLTEDEEGGELAAEEEGELVPRRAPAAVAAAPADWGVFVPVTLIFSCFALFVLGAMSFELLRGMSSYQQPSRATGPVVKFFADLAGEKLPD